MNPLSEVDQDEVRAFRGIVFRDLVPHVYIRAIEVMREHVFPPLLGRFAEKRPLAPHVVAELNHESPDHGQWLVVGFTAR